MRVSLWFVCLHNQLIFGALRVPSSSLQSDFAVSDQELYLVALGPAEPLHYWPGNCDLQAVTRLPKLHPEDRRHGAEAFLPRFIPGLVCRTHSAGQESSVPDCIFPGSYGGNHLVLRQKTGSAEDEFRWEDLGFKFEITDLEASG
jgi:hypothetical protein